MKTRQAVDDNKKVIQSADFQAAIAARRRMVQESEPSGWTPLVNQQLTAYLDNWKIFPIKSKKPGMAGTIGHRYVLYWKVYAPGTSIHNKVFRDSHSLFNTPRKDADGSESYYSGAIARLRFLFDLVFAPPTEAEKAAGEVAVSADESQWPEALDSIVAETRAGSPVLLDGAWRERQYSDNSGRFEAYFQLLAARRPHPDEEPPQSAAKAAGGSGQAENEEDEEMIDDLGDDEDDDDLGDDDDEEGVDAGSAAAVPPPPPPPVKRGPGRPRKNPQ